MYEVCAHVQTPMEWVLCFFSTQSLIFGEYTCTIVMHTVYDILVVDMCVYDM